MSRYNFNCGKFSKYLKLSGLAIASWLFIVSPWITFLTASSTILPLFVLGISGTLMTTEGTCFGEQFFRILDLIVLIFSSSNSSSFFVVTNKTILTSSLKSCPTTKPSVIKSMSSTCWYISEVPIPVSYTHLTLPTKRIV